MPNDQQSSRKGASKWELRDELRQAVVQAIAKALCSFAYPARTLDEAVGEKRELWMRMLPEAEKAAEAAFRTLDLLAPVSETGPSDPSFSYRGLAYARPIGRGVVLEELDGQPHLEDVLPEGDYDIEIKAFRRLSER